MMYLHSGASQLASSRWAILTKRFVMGYVKKVCLLVVGGGGVVLWSLWLLVAVCIHGLLLFVTVGGCCQWLLSSAMWVVVVGRHKC